MKEEKCKQKHCFNLGGSLPFTTSVPIGLIFQETTQKVPFFLDLFVEI